VVDELRLGEELGQMKLEDARGRTGLAVHERREPGLLEALGVRRGGPSAHATTLDA
jgi:hypothetical protein